MDKPSLISNAAAVGCALAAMFGIGGGVPTSVWQGRSRGHGIGGFGIRHRISYRRDQRAALRRRRATRTH